MAVCFRMFHPAASLLIALFSLAALAQKGTNLEGHQVSLLQPQTKLAVLFFIASDCPISNRYQPEMLRLRREYSARGVAFWFVYPNLTETSEAIWSHQIAFRGAESADHVLIDPHQQLTRLAAAKVTPEAAILSPVAGGVRTIYSGRLDDRYVSIGNERPKATHHDLDLALTAALAGSPIPPPAGPPVGCAIVSTR